MHTTLDALSRLRGVPNPDAASGRTLAPLMEFGTNPGALKGWVQVPSGSPPTALVVVLHGCTQGAAAYADGAGWSELAERHGFAILCPEQQSANNPNRCFNWFRPEDVGRGSGEALSIRQMVGAVLAAHPIDAARVFVTGLSAGGAMAAAMLATYPDVFAGGAVIAGLPYGAASSIPQALDRMRGVGHPTPEIAVDSVRRASPHASRWPTLSVWHGTDDRTVDGGNGDRLVEQWRRLHELEATPDQIDVVDGQQHRVWTDAAGRRAVEDYRIAGLGHGTPLRTRGERSCGVAGPFLLESGISSTWHIANGWGLLTAGAKPLGERSDAIEPVGRAASGGGGVQQVIEDALRSAGLMR